VDTEDNIRIQVPNSQILNGVVENYTLNPLRRVEVMVTVSPKADMRKTREVMQNAISPYAYLAIAGSTGPAKGAQPAPPKGAHSAPPAAPADAAPAAHAHAAHDDTGAVAGTTARASWGGKALSNLFRRQGGLAMSPSNLMAGLAEQYTQLWKLANGQFRFQLADVAAKKAPKPEVVLREVTPLGLRWQARVWAPSRR
jgi:small-conductance mechanosensitive channel